MGRRVPAGRLGLEDIAPFADERARSLRIRISHDDMADHPAHIGGDALELRHELRTDDDDARPRVANDVLIVLRFPQRVQRHRHRADLDRAEEGVEERRPIEEQQQDSLFRAHPVLVAQHGPGAVDVAQQVLVRHSHVAAFDRDVRAASFGDVPIDEPARAVERRRNPKRFSGRGHHVRAGVKS